MILTVSNLLLSFTDFSFYCQHACVCTLLDRHIIYIKIRKIFYNIFVFFFKNFALKKCNSIGKQNFMNCIYFYFISLYSQLFSTLNSYQFFFFSLCLIPAILIWYKAVVYEIPKELCSRATR